MRTIVSFSRKQNLIKIMIFRWERRIEGLIIVFWFLVISLGYILHSLFPIKSPVLFLFFVLSFCWLALSLKILSRWADSQKKKMGYKLPDGTAGIYNVPTSIYDFARNNMNKD
jgi:hypothetical protein